MLVFTEQELLEYNSGLYLTTPQFNSLILKINNYISGRLNWKTVDPHTYTESLVLLPNSNILYPSFKPIKEIIFIGDLDPEDYYLQDYRTIYLLESYESVKRFNTQYIAGVDPDPETGSDPATIQLFRTVISQLISYFDSPEFEGIKSESIPGEISVTYERSKSENNTRLEDIMMPIMGYKANRI